MATIDHFQTPGSQQTTGEHHNVPNIHAHRMSSQATLPVRFTSEALNHIRKMLAKHVEHKGLRLSMKAGKGCSGFAYIFDYVTQAQPEDRLFCTAEGIQVFIDQAWVSAFQGSTIDYVKQGLNARLECINPNESARCGCGESFSLIGGN